MRFSRLFGPGKPSSLPQIWRNVRKKRRKHKQHDKSSNLNNNLHDSDSSDDEKPRSNGWHFNYGEIPSKENCASDDEAKFLKPLEVEAKDSKKETHTKDDTGPKAADWRFGPAQIWYDMLDVPETGENFDYGFRMGDTVFT